MKITHLFALKPLALSGWLLLALVLSCTDHDVPANLPESECTATDGSPRTYPCEFVIEKVVYLAKDNTVLATVTASNQSITLSRFQAKVNTYAGNTLGMSGAATFDTRITLRRVAAPSFPVAEGYIIGLTHNSSGKFILHTPSFPGDTYGERSKIGSPVTLDMAIGETRDITFETVHPYTIGNSGMTTKPEAFFAYTTYFVDNDVTYLQFPRTTDPYRFVGSVTEAFVERLIISLSN